MPDTSPREPPHSQEAETAVLGAILLDNALLPRALLPGPAAFYSSSHRIVYTHMLKLAEAGQPLDFVTLSDSIRTAGELEQIGGASWISSLIDGTLRLPNIEAYARTIQQAARNRDTITTFHDASRMIQEDKDPEIVINRATDALDMIRRGGPNRKAAANLWDGVTGERPAPILTAAGKGGAVLTVGNVCLLSGEGGIAKSALALSLAGGIAQLGDHERGQVCGLFEGMGGRPRKPPASTPKKGSGRHQKPFRGVHYPGTLKTSAAAPPRPQGG